MSMKKGESKICVLDCFGRLTVVEKVTVNSKMRFRCRCSCGAFIVIRSCDLLSGNTRSCGCLRRELLGDRRRRHGESSNGNTSCEYRVWCKMKSRCENVRNCDYHHYGGRGIKVCCRWSVSFENFLSDMGRRPSKLHELDRYPDNNGNYEPGNCRWATRRQQNRNKRTNRLITINGETKCLVEWAEVSGVGAGTILWRLDRGWDVHRAVFLPVTR